MMRARPGQALPARGVEKGRAMTRGNDVPLAVSNAIALAKRLTRANRTAARAYRTTRAKVSTSTAAAPARLRARAAASQVDPVVRISSTSRMRRP